MTTFNFYNKSEIEKAKKGKRNFEVSFSITCDSKGLKKYIGKYDLESSHVWYKA